jgi:AmmeMemoRadiSam system protein B
MRLSAGTEARVRPAAVAGSFYPRDADELAGLVDRSIAAAARIAAPPARRLAGILVPHAGLAFSGVVAAAGWRAVPAAPRRTIVILGTNHRAGWLDGLAVWPDGAWRTPLGDVEIDEDLALAIASADRRVFVDRAAHRDEHSIEVQLPFLRVLDPTARIVPIAASPGRGRAAAEVGAALGSVLRGARSSGADVVLAISSDMAHYPPEERCRRITEALLPAIVGLEVDRLDALERDIAQGGAGTVCGMCGIEPTLVGLAALRAMGAGEGIPLARATSADAGGPPDRTVGYLSVAFAG